MVERAILIGYIPDKIVIDSDVLSLRPIDGFEEVVTSIKKTFHSKDGFCFPVSSNVKYDFVLEGSKFEKKELSRGPLFQAESFKFYSTHKFELKSQAVEEFKKFALNPSFFLTQIIGYASGYRVMPSDFWFDGKIPIKPTHNVVGCQYDKIVSKAHQTWLSFSELAREELLSIFYLYNRSASYHWHFEKFSHDFMIFDSALNFYRRHVQEVGKGKTRYSKFLNLLDVSYDPESIVKFVDMRNNLFHEVKWGGGAPCFFNSDDVLYSSLELRRMLHAVLGRLIGLEGSYFHSEWKCLGTRFFDGQ